MTANKTYGPNDVWPRHTTPRINDAYNLARSYGWTLTRQSNHNTFLLACPDNSCTKTVYSSGKGRESFAKGLITFIRRCSHNEALIASITEVEALFSEVRRLLDAVEQKLVSRHLSAQLSDRIDADEQGDDIEHLLLAAEEKERRALALLDELTTTGEAHEAIEVADNKVTQARVTLNGMDRGNQQVAATWEKWKLVRADVNQYRAQLERSSPPVPPKLEKHQRDH